MPRAHCGPRTITDNVNPLDRVFDARVRVYKPGTSTLITDNIFMDRVGSGKFSQGWLADEGVIEFWLETPQIVDLGVTRQNQAEQIRKDIYVGCVYPWLRTIKDIGAMGDGSTVDSAAINADFASMGPGDARLVPDGTYMCDEPIQWPTEDGCAIFASPAPQTRLGSAVFKAVAGGTPLPAIAATREWLTGDASQRDPQGLTLSGLSFDGGGFRANQSHDTQIETTSHTVNGLVVHGSGLKLKDVFVLSANQHGIVCAGTTSSPDSGSQVISESHENTFTGCGVRYTGGDSFHADGGAMDAWVDTFKPQFAGGHCFFIDDKCPAWSFQNCHPSWAAKDIFHLLSGWQVRVIGNYIGGLAVYMDGSGQSPRRGIYIEGGPAIIMGNSINSYPPIKSTDHMVGIYMKNGPVNCIGNTLITRPDETAIMLDSFPSPLPSPSNVQFNFAMTS